MEQEVELLCRAAANHLYLGQFEALRAALLSLRKRKPEVAQAILNTIVYEGGRFDGVLWSSTCSSPAHLAWLSTVELLQFGSGLGMGNFDPEILRTKVEFLLFVQLLRSWASKMSTQRSSEVDIDDEKHDYGQNSPSVDLLHRISGLVLRELRLDIAVDVEEPAGEGFSCSDEELKALCDILLDQSEVLDVLCLNIRKQIIWSKKNGSELAISVSGAACGSTPSAVEAFDTLVGIQRNVQMAHLRVLNQCVEADDIAGAISRLRFLHLDFGVENSEYR